MIKLMDRELIRGFFKAYLVSLTSLLSLYIVIDLFTNLDDFAGGHATMLQVLLRIGTYYGYKVFEIFDRLCEVIVLLAAMFTITWMQRNNEQMPLLSSGISTHRIVSPVLGCGFFMLSLAVLNQEWVIPRIADQLMFDKDDPTGEKDLNVKGAYEPNNIHIEGGKASRVGMAVRPFRVTIPDGLAGTQIHLEAAEGRYVSTGPHQGGWELTNTKPADVETWDPKVLEVRDTGRYFLHTRDVTFERLTRNVNWFNKASTLRLYQELMTPETGRQANMAVLFHIRLTRPILGMLLVLLGLSVVLRDQNRNMIISTGACLVLCGLFFVICYICRTMGENDYLTPALSAWMPILLFGPLGLAMFDAIHT
jgi:lipopolysaccharide export system permease protein